MNTFAKLHCSAAIALIEHGHYPEAIDNLRAALRLTHDRRVWSKLMLAIRELGKLARPAEAHIDIDGGNEHLRGQD
jgi:hypothetical protein